MILGLRIAIVPARDTVPALAVGAGAGRSDASRTHCFANTVSASAPDLAAAKAWYARVFETQPYFDEPFYVGFNIGGFELGLIPDGSPSTAGVSALWGVENIATEHARILALGASELDAVKEVGGGIKVSALADPFGNRLGLIENPQFDVKALR